MSLSNKDIMRLDRQAQAQAEFSKAVNSGAGKKLMEERLLLEETHGGVKRLEQAQKILDDAGKEATGIVSEANAKAMQIKQHTAKTVAESQALQNARHANLAKKDTELKAREKAIQETEHGLSLRLKECVARENGLNMRESAVRAAESVLEAKKSTFESNQQTFKARTERLRQAIGS